jgi:hypothetical protein
VNHSKMAAAGSDYDESDHESDNESSDPDRGAGTGAKKKTRKVKTFPPYTEKEISVVTKLQDWFDKRGRAAAGRRTLRSVGWLCPKELPTCTIDMATMDPLKSAKLLLKTRSGPEISRDIIQMIEQYFINVNDDEYAIDHVFKVILPEAIRYQNFTMIDYIFGLMKEKKEYFPLPRNDDSDFYFYKLILAAVEANNAEILRRLFELHRDGTLEYEVNGWDIFFDESRDDKEKDDEFYFAKIIYAAFEHGTREIIEILNEFDFFDEFNILVETGDPGPLAIAARAGRSVEFMQFLMDEIRPQDAAEDQRLLEFAVRNEELFDYLVARGDVVQGGETLWEAEVAAARNGNLNILRRIAEIRRAQAEGDEELFFNNSEAFREAVRKNRLDIIRYFIAERKADDVAWLLYGGTRRIEGTGHAVSYTSNVDGRLRNINIKTLSLEMARLLVSHVSRDSLFFKTLMAEAVKLGRDDIVREFS